MGAPVIVGFVNRNGFPVSCRTSKWHYCVEANEILKDREGRVITDEAFMQFVGDKKLSVIREVLHSDGTKKRIEFPINQNPGEATPVPGTINHGLPEENHEAYKPLGHTPKIDPSDVITPFGEDGKEEPVEAQTPTVETPVETETEEEPEVEEDSVEESTDGFEDMSNKELRELCKDAGLSEKGKKDVLIARLRGEENGTN